jgi:tetratricopeptide (TPR) repeat protein/predicted Ser/Thr protein kinase
MDETLVETAGASQGHAPLSRGELVGRYVVLDKLGAGGMGVVFAAYDPELDRKVALKLLHAQPSEQSKATEGHKRLLREAQAMAKLSHPNVIAVHDVGEHQGRVFLAMEFVEGATLGDWAKKEPRAWREIVEVFSRAGAGLGAAHEKGLVHRDFKPDNVMVADDGRVRVMDFGLARTDSNDRAKTPLAELDELVHTGGGGELGTALTRHGAVIGTPAYMAPEQWMGEATDPRTDQFSFCVALYEALYGRRPFAGEGMAALALQVTEGKVREPPSSKAPGWLRKVVLRGLGQEPPARFHSMNDLLAALSAGEGRRRRNRAVAGLAFVGIAVGGVYGYDRYDHAQVVAACEAEGDAIDEVWNDESQTNVRAGLLATGVSYAEVTVEKVTPWIDKQADDWRHARTEACMNNAVFQTWDAVTYDKAQWCLQERRLELSTLVTQLVAADNDDARQAVRAAVELSPVVACVDTTSLAGSAAPPAENLRPEIAEIREELSRARYLEAAGKYREGLEAAQAARVRAERLSWPPLLATALATEASLLERSGAYEESEETGIAAYVLAARSRDWGTAASAATILANVVGYHRRNSSQGTTWAKHATVAIAHAGDPLGLREAFRAKTLGSIHYVLREREAAVRHIETALVTWEQVLGPEHPRVATALNSLGAVHGEFGDYEKALPLFERAVAIREQALGAEHPTFAGNLANLATTYRFTGERERARRLYERALTIQERALGSDHPDVAGTINHLGLLARTNGDYEQAKRQFRRAQSIWEQALGPAEPGVASALINIAHVHRLEGDDEAAKSLYVEGLALREKIVGSHGHALVPPLLALGEVLVRTGEYASAIEQFERAVAIRTQTEAEPELLAEAHFGLAQALWDAPADTGRDQKRALELARKARDEYGETDGNAKQLADVEAWLVKHGGEE